MEKLDKKINKIQTGGSLNMIAYQVQISKLACDYVKKKFPEFDNLYVLKRNKQIIKYIMKVIDTIMKDKTLFVDRESVKKLNKTELCIGICKTLLNLTNEEALVVSSDIEFIVEEFYKRKSFFLKLYRKFKNPFNI